MSDARWQRFWKSLLGEHEFYKTKQFSDSITVAEMKEGCNAMRIYRNTDGTWSLMPNWFKTAEQNHKRGATTTYTDFNKIPEHIQEKLGVLLLHEPGGDWLAGVGKRIDTGVFWLEDE